MYACKLTLLYSTFIASYIKKLRKNDRWAIIGKY